MLQANAKKHLFRRLGEQAPTGEGTFNHVVDGAPSQQVWEFPVALVNICRAAITQ